MTTYKLTIAYDGTAYLGWQKTKMGPSIQASVEGVLQTILQEPVFVEGASRTDAGVHARGQIGTFHTHKAIDLNKLFVSLNQLLPPDIAIMQIESVADDFHPTLHSLEKEYHYTVCTNAAQYPEDRFYAWHFYHPIDLAAMQHAASQLLGKHDFKAFCNVKNNESYDCHTRRLTKLDIQALPEKKFQVIISGPNFLYKMVRNIVGTLFYIGANKLDKDCIPLLLKEGDRTKAGMTAPAHGLCLHKITYAR